MPTRSKSIFNLFTMFALLISMIGSAIFVTPAYATGITVDTTIDEDIANGVCSLREAIKAANTDAAYNGCTAGAGADTITLPAGTYTLGSVLPDVTSTITINGNGSANTIIQANANPNVATYRIFRLLNGILTLNGLTVRNGRCAGACGQSGDSGGAIMIYPGTLNVINSVLSGNTGTGVGGAIYVNSTGALNVTNSTVSNNIAGGDGGGIYSQGTTIITNSTITNNSGSYGGGISAAIGTLAITGSTVSDNVAGGGGGGIYSGNWVPLTISGSSFSNNRATLNGRGGGISANGLDTTITNSTFSGNYVLCTTYGQGGGVTIASRAGGTYTLKNNTFSGNYASSSCGYGGGIYVWDQPLNMYNTIVTNSPSGGDCLGSIAADSYNIDSDGSCNGATTQTSASINLGAFQNNGGTTSTFAITNSSSAFDAGDNANCAATDQRGVTRPQGAACDVGAYELDAPPTATIVVTDDALKIGETSLVTFTFTEAITGFTNADLTIANGVLTNVSTADGGKIWTATFTPTANITDATNVITLDNTGVADLSSNAGIGSTDSNNYAIDTVRPTVGIVVADTLLLAGETSTVTITFSEAVTNFDNADLTIANGVLTNVSTADGGIIWTATFTPTVNVTDATNLITLDNTGVTDINGNAGTGSTDSNNYAIDTVLPTVGIVVTDSLLISGETSLVTFTFTKAVSGFANDDLTIENGTLTNVSSADGGITWTATLTPTANITDATNIITLNNASVADLSGNPGTGTTDSNNYALDTENVAVLSTNLSANYIVTGPTTFMVIFSEDVYNPTGDTETDDVTNPANYLLVENGVNGIVDTTSCGPVPGTGGVQPDDIQTSVTSVTYDQPTLTATVTLASAPPIGEYRLFICGTTSIIDLALNELNGGLDYIFDFVVTAPTREGRGNNASTLPKTGFTPNKVTTLPAQPAHLAYSDLGSLWLEVPSLNIKTSIVGVPQAENNDWDVKWLGQDTGWLNGTAFPTWNGNSVLTAHVTDSNGLPGPFADLKDLKYDNQIIVHMGSAQYIYEIRSSKLVRPYSTSFAFESLQDHSYLTLITCQGYNPLNETYLFRRIVRAVLVEVK